MCAAVFDVCTNAFIATCYRVDGSRLEPWWGKEISLNHIRPDRPWVAPSLLCNRYRISLG